MKHDRRAVGPSGDETGDGDLATKRTGEPFRQADPRPPRRRRRGRQTALLALTLLIIAGARIVLLPDYLLHWDEVQFALGATHLDVRLHQPHPPGYFLFIAAVRTVNTLGGLSIEHSLHAVVIAGVMVAALALFALAKGLWGTAAGWFTLTLFAISPIQYYYGLLALSYPPELAVVLALAWFVFEARRKRSYRQALAAAALLGLGGGIRQNILIFYFPLFLLSFKPFNWRRRLGLLTTAAIAFFSWWPLLLTAPGGLSGYQQAVAIHQARVFSPRVAVLNGIGAVATNAVTCWRIIFASLGANAIWLVVAAAAIFPSGSSHRSRSRRRRNMLFYLALGAPAATFFILVLADSPGYLLVFHAVLILFCASGFTAAIGWVTPGRKRGEDPVISSSPVTESPPDPANHSTAGHGSAGKRLIFALICLSPLVLGARPISRFFSEHGELSYRRLVDTENRLRERITWITQAMSPERTLLVSALEFWELGFRQSMYYLPDYASLLLYPDPSLGIGSPATATLAQHRRIESLPPIWRVPERYDELIFFRSEAAIVRQVTVAPADVVESTPQIFRETRLPSGDTLYGLSLEELRAAGFELYVRRGRLFFR